MDFDDSPREDEKKEPLKENTNKKMGTMTKGFFQIEDIDDYVDEFVETKKQKEKLVQINKEKRQQSQDNGYSPHHQRKRNPRNIKLQPLKKESPHVLMSVGIEDQNPESEKQKKVEKKKKPMIMEFSSEQQEQKKVQKDEQEEVEEKKVYTEQDREQQIGGEESPGSQIQERDLNSPFDKILKQIDPERNLNFTLKRDKEWLNKLRPVFKVHYFRNNQYLMAAKLASSNATTTFLASINQEDFVQNGIGYIGKVKTNFMGNLVNIFGAGFNPSDSKGNNRKPRQPRQLLATIEYETNFFGSSKPRDFKVFVLKPSISYYQLVGTKKGEDEVPLNQLFHHHLNKGKMYVLSNKKPEWNDRVGGYMLNFKGRAKKASIKNFIIEDETKESEDPDEREIMMFGKLDEDQFRMDIKYPLSPYLGLGIALSTFGGKIGCQ